MLFAMAHAGDVLENPVTRERLTFLQTAADTRGELLRIEFSFEPGGFVAAEHVHPAQEERIEIVAGAPAFRIAGRERVGRAGDVVVVPPGTPHKWWNGGDVEARAFVELRPALRMEALFETMAALARAGKLNRKGFPDPLRGAVIARAFKAEIAPAHDSATPFGWLPLPLMSALLVVLGAVGRALGYRSLVADR